MKSNFEMCKWIGLGSVGAQRSSEATSTSRGQKIFGHTDIVKRTTGCVYARHGEGSMLKQIGNFLHEPMDAMGPHVKFVTENVTNGRNISARIIWHLGCTKSMLHTLSEFQQQKDAGMFINSCYMHCQTMSNITWHSPTSPRLNNKTIAEAVGDGYFGRRKVTDTDCPYACNSTCYHMDFN